MLRRVSTYCGAAGSGVVKIFREVTVGLLFEPFGDVRDHPHGRPIQLCAQVPVSPKRRVAKE